MDLSAQGAPETVQASPRPGPSATPGAPVGAFCGACMRVRVCAPRIVLAPDADREYGHLPDSNVFALKQGEGGVLGYVAAQRTYAMQAQDAGSFEENSLIYQPQ